MCLANISICKSLCVKFAFYVNIRIVDNTARKAFFFLVTQIMYIYFLMLS